MAKKSLPDHFDAEAFGQRIRKRREALGWSQGELAERTGIRANRLSPYENGLSAPDDPATLLVLARVLGKSVDWLLTGRDSPMTPEEQEDYDRGRRDLARRIRRMLDREIETPATQARAGVEEIDETEELEQQEERAGHTARRTRGTGS